MSDKDKYENRLKYYRLYNILITKFQDSSLNFENIMTEVHHILPKCMGGDDSKLNLVRLPTREHIFAHLILTRIYPDNDKLVYAANRMLSGSQQRCQAVKSLSTKTVARIRSEAVRLRSKLISGQNHPLFGKTLSLEYRRKISNSMKGSKNHFYGKSHSQAAKDKIGEASKKRMCKELNPFLGKHLSTETKSKISSALKGKMVGGKNPRSRRIITPTGDIFDSMSDYTRKFNISMSTLIRYLKTPNSGYDYLD